MIRTLFLLIILLAVSGVSGCTSFRIQHECCTNCLDAFSQSPVGSGPGGARCGEFTSSLYLSKECDFYFTSNPMTVAQCSGK